MPSSANIEKLEKKLSFLPGHTFHKVGQPEAAKPLRMTPAPPSIHPPQDMDNYRKSHAFDYLASVPTFSDNKPGIGRQWWCG